MFFEEYLLNLILYLDNLVGYGKIICFGSMILEKYNNIIVNIIG